MTGPALQPALRSLLAVGLLGSIYRKREEADLVTAAIEPRLPDVCAFRVYRAIAEGIGGDSTCAVTELEKRLEIDPHDDTSKVIYSVAMLLAGNADWKRWIDNVVATSIDPVARESAFGVIAYLKTLTRH